MFGRGFWSCVGRIVWYINGIKVVWWKNTFAFPCFPCSTFNIGFFNNQNIKKVVLPDVAKWSKPIKWNIVHKNCFGFAIFGLFCVEKFFNFLSGLSLVFFLLILVDNTWVVVVVVHYITTTTRLSMKANVLYVRVHILRRV